MYIKIRSKTNLRLTSSGEHIIPEEFMPPELHFIFFFRQNSNSYAYCTNWRLFGSLCSFDCEVGYKLIGDRNVKCVNGEADSLFYWNGTAPICQRK